MIKREIEQEVMPRSQWKERKEQLLSLHVLCKGRALAYWVDLVLWLHGSRLLKTTSSKHVRTRDYERVEHAA